MNRVRGEVFAGEGYGSLRYRLFVAANDHIERSIAHGFYCEAISVTESVISDRLESRLSFLTNKNFGFSTLGCIKIHKEGLKSGWFIKTLQTLLLSPKIT